MAYHQPFRGDLDNALRYFLKNDPDHTSGSFWYAGSTEIAVKSTKEAKTAQAILRKHLPEQFLPVVRFALPQTVWYLNVQSPAVAKQLREVVNTVLVNIANEISNSPEIRIKVHTSPLQWAKSGPTLQLTPKNRQRTQHIEAINALRKYIPASLHAAIRFLPPKTTWYLIVEKGVAANRMNALLDTLVSRIKADVGFEPHIKIAVQPSHLRWAQSGFPLVFPEHLDVELPDEDDAQQFLRDFLGS